MTEYLTDLMCVILMIIIDTHAKVTSEAALVKAASSHAKAERVAELARLQSSLSRSQELHGGGKAAHAGEVEEYESKLERSGGFYFSFYHMTEYSTIIML